MAAGANDLAAIKRTTQASTGCGGCAGVIASLLEEPVVDASSESSLAYALVS